MPVGHPDTARFDHLPSIATNWRGATGFDQGFAYDRAGRIRAKGPTLATAMTYDYSDPLTPDHAPGAVTTAGVTTPFTYDDNGNMLTGLAGKIMTYDGENRPENVLQQGSRSERLHERRDWRHRTAPLVPVRDRG